MVKSDIITNFLHATLPNNITILLLLYIVEANPISLYTGMYVKEEEKN